jgi:hypothetical protein
MGAFFDARASLVLSFETTLYSVGLANTMVLSRGLPYRGGGGRRGIDCLFKGCVFIFRSMVPRASGGAVANAPVRAHGR